MGKIIVYGALPSPPTRAVMVLCTALGVDYELKEVNYQEQEHKTPEYRNKLNPQAQFPVIDDNGFILQESRAILEYLMDTYAKDDSLFPKDTKTRAVIRARLYFDCGTIWPAMVYTFRPVIEGGKLDENKLKMLEGTYQTLEDYLTRDKWVAGPKLTIADISFSSIMSSLEAFQNFDKSKYPKIAKWLEECQKAIPGYDINIKGAKALAENMKARIAANANKA